MSGKSYQDLLPWSWIFRTQLHPAEPLSNETGWLLVARTPQAGIFDRMASVSKGPGFGFERHPLFCHPSAS